MSSMTRPLRGALTAAALVAAALAFAGRAAAGEAHADASATTQPEACKLALRLARLDTSNGHVTASHCECLESRDEPTAPWSCTAFVTYR